MLRNPSGAPRKRLFQHIPGMSQPNHVRNGALFAAVALVTLFVLFTRPSVPFLGGGSTEYSAEVDTGANVRPGRTPVRVAGVEVGQVTSVKRIDGARGVKVTFDVKDDADVEIKKDASATLRWRTLLGRNLYVDLVPGSRSAPAMEDGGLIPRSRTSTQVELDEVLEPLDGEGRQSVKTAIKEFDKGFQAPDAVAGAARQSGPALRSVASGLPGLRGQSAGDLTELVGNTSKLLGALSQDEVALGGLITDGNTALSVTAANRQPLGATFDQAPAALSTTRSTMARLRSTLDQLDPVTRSLTPGVKDLADSSVKAQRLFDVARPLLRTARPTLRDLRPAVSLLKRTSADGTQVMDGLTPVLDRTRDSIIPWLNERSDDTKLTNGEAIGPAVASASSAFGNGDRYGPLAHFEPGAGESIVTSTPCTTRLLDPDASTTDKVKCEVLSRALMSLFGGQPADQIKVKGSLVPERLVQKFLNRKGGR